MKEEKKILMDSIVVIDEKKKHAHQNNHQLRASIEILERKKQLAYVHLAQFEKMFRQNAPMIPISRKSSVRLYKLEGKKCYYCCYRYQNYIILKLHKIIFSSKEKNL